MTTYGGANGIGIIFCIDTDGNGYRDLYDFSGGDNGSEPFGNLTLYGNKFYGMTVQGGSSNYGNIFSIDTNGSGYKDIFNFNNNISYMPFGSLIYATGVLFGTVQHGGAYGNGVIFSIDTDGSEYKDLYNFTVYGEIPGGNLTLSGDILYGMVNNAAGSPNYGVLYSFKDTNGALGVNEVKSNGGEIKIYPNPATTQLNIQIITGQPNLGVGDYFYFYDNMGQLVEKKLLTNNLTTIPLTQLAAGIYYYRILDNQQNQIKTDKLLIIR